MGQISLADVAAARARVDVYGRYVRLKKVGQWLTGRCPFHADKNPSFAVINGRWHCFTGCGRGSVIDFVMRLKTLDFAAAVRELVLTRAISARERPTPQPIRATAKDAPDDTPTRIAAARKIWDEATNPRLVEYYLHSRGLPQRVFPLALRGHDRIWCTETQQYRPAVVAAFTAGAEEVPTAVQYTWVERSLTFDGNTEYVKGARSTDLETPRISRGSLGAGAVRLAAAGAVLGLAEGVETALAAAWIFRGRASGVWATGGTSRLGSIALPDFVQKVIIYADNGGPGEAAAAKAVETYREQRIDAVAVFPKSGYGDFLEQLIARH